jgi:hypothetical protein
MVVVLLGTSPGVRLEMDIVDATIQAKQSMVSGSGGEGWERIYMNLRNVINNECVYASSRKRLSQ